MKKPLNRLLYRFLDQEMHKVQEKGIISKEQKEDIMGQYEEGRGFNVLWVVASVGATLVGFGFLLVVASNWEAIGDFWKLMVIVGAISAALLASLRTEPVNRYTSKGLLYLAVILYGSGIFLVIDAFELDIIFSTAFFLWSLGALGVCVWKRDLILLIAAHILSITGVLVGFDEWIAVHAIVMGGLLITANHLFNFRTVGTYFLIAATLVTILYFPIHYGLNGVLSMLLFVILGNVMIYLRHPLDREPFIRMGLLTMGVAGFTLSFSGVWESWELIGDGGLPSVLFSIVFAAYMMVLLTRKRIIPLVVIGALIIRFYFDSLYDFLPRALFFVLGGLMILAIGFYIERRYDEKPGKRGNGPS